MYNDRISIIDASANHLGSSEDQLIIGIVNTQLHVLSFCHPTLPSSVHTNDAGGMVPNEAEKERRGKKAPNREAVVRVGPWRWRGRSNAAAPMAACG